MLDYDSMRSKVKRLTEKPDKDPAKLPRTEKEQDMVSIFNLLYPAEISSTGSFLTIRGSNASALSVDNTTDLGVPSPPKALNGIRQRLGLGLGLDEDELDVGSGTEDDALLLTPTRGRRTGRTLLARTSSIISSYSALLSPQRDSDFDEDENREVPTTHSSPLRQSSEARSFTSSDLSTTEGQDVPSTQSSPARPKPDSSITSALSTTSVDDLRRTSSIYSAQSTSTLIPKSPVGDSSSTRGGTRPRQKSNPRNQSRPFFEPSELEEIMAPLKEEFMRKQADKLEQAKAAYEQLNEQLMSELPQLIDLRYAAISHPLLAPAMRELSTNYL